jgi:hypothetical protein
MKGMFSVRAFDRGHVTVGSWAVALVGLSLAVLAICSGGAKGAPSSSSSSSASPTGNLCAVAHGVARDIVNATSVTNGNVTPANLKTTYETIARAEPALLASSSGSIKTDLRQVFGFVNLLIADFEQVNWQPSGISKYAPELLPRAAKVQRPLHALKVYFNTTCKLDV